MIGRLSRLKPDHNCADRHFAQVGAIGSSKLKADDDLPLAAVLSQLDESLAGTLRHAGRRAEAAAVEAERRELWQRWDRKLPNNPFVRQQMAGAARLR